MAYGRKISRESLIEAALEILIENGSSNVTINEVAARLKCSTQPISRQFGGMKGLRRELIDAAEQYAREKYFTSNGNDLEIFTHNGYGVVDMAMDEPNLYRFLYMGESGRAGFIAYPDCSEKWAPNISEVLEISPEAADNFMSTMVFYTQGLSAMIVSGIVEGNKEQVYNMIAETGDLFLTALGVPREKFEELKKAERKK